MATFEQLGLVNQVLGNVYGLVNNMRDNATGYKAQSATADIPTLAATMRADANLYVTRIGWVTALAQRNATLFQSALTALGLTLAEATSLKSTLLNVANHTIAATLNTAADVNAEADFILANVPTFERLW